MFNVPRINPIPNPIICKSTHTTGNSAHVHIGCIPSDIANPTKISRLIPNCIVAVAAAVATNICPGIGNRFKYAAFS